MESTILSDKVSVCVCMHVCVREEGGEGSVIRKHGGLMVYVFLGSLHLEILLLIMWTISKGSWTIGFRGLL